MKARFKGERNYTQYIDVSEISDHMREKERIYAGGVHNDLLISDIISQPFNNENGKYESVSFQTYLKPINWFCKVTQGRAGNKYYNLTGLSISERKILYRILCNYSNIKKYNIPPYIITIFMHLCINKTGVDFRYINSDESMFDNFRSFLFYDDNNQIISPNKVKQIFIKCIKFVGHDYDKWEYKNGSWFNNSKKVNEQSYYSKYVLSQNKKDDK